MNNENFDFSEEIDKEMWDLDWDLEDADDLAWAKKAIKRHYRFVGIRRYTGWNNETNQWYKSLHLQIFKSVSYTHLTLPTKRIV